MPNVDVCTPYHYQSAATTNPNLVKSGPCQLCSIDLNTESAAAVVVKLHDTASTPTAGTTAIKRAFKIPAGGGYSKSFPKPLQFQNGLAFTTTLLIASSDTQAIEANKTSIDLDIA